MGLVVWRGKVPGSPCAMIQKVGLRNSCAPGCRDYGLIGKGTERCGGRRTTKGVNYRWGMTSEELPMTRPLYLQISKGDGTGQFGGGRREALYGSDQCSSP